MPRTLSSKTECEKHQPPSTLAFGLGCKKPKSSCSGHNREGKDGPKIFASGISAHLAKWIASGRTSGSGFGSFSQSRTNWESGLLGGKWDLDLGIWTFQTGRGRCRATIHAAQRSSIRKQDHHSLVTVRMQTTFFRKLVRSAQPCRQADTLMASS